jgi:hypothetical protein
MEVSENFMEQTMEIIVDEFLMLEAEGKILISLY